MIFSLFNQSGRWHSSLFGICSSRIGSIIKMPRQIKYVGGVDRGEFLGYYKYINASETKVYNA